MPRTLDPFRLLLFAVAGWMNHEQQQILDYLREENRIPHAQLGTRRLRFDDEQRRGLAVRAKLLGTESTCRSCHHRDTRYSAAMAS
ncbi:MAG TPA: hypothetical protein VMG82_26235 [Candidatus Sulfotelmatobacter sp.]|nr:hypothetical protein [Candidatus Sulfotelmatobacter sp.]